LIHTICVMRRLGAPTCIPLMDMSAWDQALAAARDRNAGGR
jgi:hypothetical protein